MVLLERERFPRDHVGESLLPASMPVLEELGVLPQMERARFPKKWGATMLWGKDPEPWSWYVRETNRSFPHACQVWRPTFDKILLDNARAFGVNVREGYAVTAALVEDGRTYGVKFRTGDGSENIIEADWIIDASGQAALLSRTLGLRRWDDQFRNMAIYGYFSGSKRLPAPDSTNIFIESYEHGWAWNIPLANNIASVGVVIDSEVGQHGIRQSGVREQYRRQLDSTRHTRDMLSAAEIISGPEVIKDWSYTSQRGDMFLDPFREAIEIGRRSGVPVHITHFYQKSPAPGGAPRLLGLVEDASESGQDVTFDSYPYSLGSPRILIVFPDWVHEGGPERLKLALADEDVRERLRTEIVPRAPTWHDMWLTYFKRPENHRYEGRSIAEVAESRGQHPVDALCDLLIEEDLQTCYLGEGLNPRTLPSFVAHPLSMVGSDAVLLGQFPSPRTYGCFPVILAEYVREERQLSLPDAIRKMTSFPAQRLGLQDRGVLRDGMAADVTVFDPHSVKVPATRTNPKQLPVGIEYVIVNGEVVVDRGQHTGALPGRAIRRR